jgi:hypothetical protein
VDVASGRREWAEHPDAEVFRHAPVEWYDLRSERGRQTVIQRLVPSSLLRTHAVIFAPGAAADPTALATLQVELGSLTPLTPEAVDPAVVAWFSEYRRAARQRRTLIGRRGAAYRSLEMLEDRVGMVPVEAPGGGSGLAPVEEVRREMAREIEQIDILMDALERRGAPAYAAWVECWQRGSRGGLAPIIPADWGFTSAG